MLIDIQLNPATTTWPALREAAQAAEATGFATVWAWDHLSGATMRGNTMLECFTLLGALAEATTTVGLGSLVANVVNRHPVMLANAAASVDAISGGRFILGLGAGASPTSPFAAEHHAVGIPLGATLKERHRRFEAALDVIADLWAPARPAELAGFIRPARALPVMVGVNSGALATIAGRRTDGVNVRWGHPDMANLLATANDAHRQHRPDEPWTSSVWAFWDEALADPAHPTRRELDTLGVDRLVLVCVGPADPAAITRAGRWLVH